MFSEIHEILPNFSSTLHFNKFIPFTFLLVQILKIKKKKKKKKRINIYQLDVFLRWDYEPPYIQTVHQN